MYRKFEFLERERVGDHIHATRAGAHRTPSLIFLEVSFPLFLDQFWVNIR